VVEKSQKKKKKWKRTRGKKLSRCTPCPRDPRRGNKKAEVQPSGRRGKRSENRKSALWADVGIKGLIKKKSTYMWRTFKKGQTSPQRRGGEGKKGKRVYCKDCRSGPSHKTQKKNSGRKKPKRLRRKKRTGSQKRLNCFPVKS